MSNLNIDSLLTIDDTGMPQAPSIRQLVDKDIALLWQRDTTKDKRNYIAQCGIIYYLGDPKSPARQQGLSDREALDMAIEQFDLPKDYLPDALVKKLIDKYYKQNITEAGIAIENLNKSIHLISLAANKINDLLLTSLLDHERVCKDCGKKLSWDYPSERCRFCKEKIQELRGDRYNYGFRGFKRRSDFKSGRSRRRYY